MMKIDKEKLQFIGGAIVVLAAALIMLPGLLSVLLGLGRIALVIAIAGGACLTLAYTVHFARRKRDAASSTSASNQENKPS